MKKVIFFVVSVLTVSCALAAKVKETSNLVVYKGESFEISVFNQKVAKREIKKAKYVYCFEVADFNLDQDNCSDSWDCFFNSFTGEYAITNYVKSGESIKWVAVIFSKNGARLEEFTPTTKDHLKNFEAVDPSTKEIGLVGYTSKAGYCNAKHNDKHNSIIVFIK